jgi:hypothetical protein
MIKQKKILLKLSKPFDNNKKAKSIVCTIELNAKNPLIEYSYKIEKTEKDNESIPKGKIRKSRKKNKKDKFIDNKIKTINLTIINTINKPTRLAA